VRPTAGAWDAAAVDAAALIERLEADGARLADVAAGTDRDAWDATAPGTELTLREVVVHTGCVHRWSADIVRRRLTTDETGGSATFRPSLADDDVVAWFRAGLAALATTLRDTPDDARAWQFGQMVPARSAWARRQAHETAVHRFDVEGAAGVGVTACDPELARDGIAEVVGFARGFQVQGTGRLRLQASDGPDWLVTFDDDDRIRGVPVAADAEAVPHADATVSGTSSELYRWLWNRPSPAVVTGDPAVAALWRRVQVT
jgi:uncharacterized protein (TIGR03083 family)